MNNKFDELTKSLAQSVTRRAALTRFGLGLASLVALSSISSADDSPERGLVKIPVAGKSDWSIVPPAFTPPFVFNGTDGALYVRHLPLVGKISLSGRDVSIEGKISADFNAELDVTFSGPIWAPVTITSTINGSKKIIFQGSGLGETVGLVSTGVLRLDGRGPFQGQRLELEFTEVGPDNYNLNGVLTRPPGR